MDSYWLHYLNYGPIDHTSSTRHLVCTRNVLGQTVSSYGWCNGITCVVPLFRFLSELFASDRLSCQRLESLPHVDLVFGAFRERLGVQPSFYVQASTYHPHHTYYDKFLVFLCPYVRTTLEVSSFSGIEVG